MPRKPTSKKSKKYLDKDDIELALISDEDDDELDKIIISEDEEDEEEEDDVPPRDILEVTDKHGKTITLEGEALEKYLLEAAPFTIGEVTDEFLPISPHPDRDCHSPQLSETDAPPDSGPLSDPISPQPLYEVRPSTPPPPDRQEDTNSPRPSVSDRIISFRPQPPLEYPSPALDQHTTTTPSSDRDCDSPQLSETDAPPDSDPIDFRPSTPPSPDWDEDTISSPPPASDQLSPAQDQHTTTPPPTDRLSLRAVLWILI